MTTAGMDFYALLAVPPTATDAEIRKAYRKAALKHHPDKNPDNPTVAEKFHLLTQAYEALLDPKVRAAFDKTREVKAAQKARERKYDDETRRMREDLYRREREAKLRKMEAYENVENEEEKAQKDLQRELDRLRAEGARLRAKRDAELKAQAAAPMPRQSSSDLKDKPVSGQEEQLSTESQVTEEDRTIKIKFRKSFDKSSLSENYLEELFSQFGEVEHTILGRKGVIIMYRSVVAANNAIKDACSSGKEFEKIIKDIGWASGQVPEIIHRASQPTANHSPSVPDEPSPPPISVDTLQSSQPISSTPSNPPKSFRFSGFKSSIPVGTNHSDYESMTLLRLRTAQAEKEKSETEKKALESNRLESIDLTGD